MEDVVPEAESLLHPINLSGDEVEERQNPEAAKQEGEERGRRFIKHLSDLVTGGDADEDKQTQQAEKETVPEGGKDEEKRGRLLDNIISTFVSPSSPKTGNITQQNVEAFDEKRENESGFRSTEEVDGGGGLIKSIVSNLFHHSEGEVRESSQENKMEEMVKVGKKTKQRKQRGVEE